MNVEFTQKEIEDLKKLISNFNLYYENKDDSWNFNDLEDQRQLACEIVNILTDKI
ncbi:hypothetical protein FACS189430_12480 [Bacteroidia bacterium]|nr:hypothetical protein FACS189430_12480 [Bacteroidia bacterium]